MTVTCQTNNGMCLLFFKRILKVNVSLTKVNFVIFIFLRYLLKKWLPIILKMDTASSILITAD